ncbi:MAG: rod shape-determining protein MreC [Scytolyngbya sp. HA4215-MV1]|nr:rod shape-determining protein MreC [Scytolyngbya sp. HA4215-MV1]
MYTLRRWWDRHRFQIILVSLTLGTALFLRQTQGALVLEIYQLLTRPFQGNPTQQSRLEDARILELQQRLVEMESQNDELKKVLGYTTENKVPQEIISPVIGRSSDHWWQQITLGRGSRDGISMGDIVMAPGGVVGRIVGVTASTSRVLLLSDPSNQVGVSISRSRSMGYMRGQSGNRAVMEFFDKVPDVKRGDAVATSAFSQLYPAGLPIGRVESINLSKSPAPEAVIELSAPISYLEWAVVRSGKTSSQPTSDSQPSDSAPSNSVPSSSEPSQEATP